MSKYFHKNLDTKDEVIAKRDLILSKKKQTKADREMLDDIQTFLKELQGICPIKRISPRFQ